MDGSRPPRGGFKRLSSLIAAVALAGACTGRTPLDDTEVGGASGGSPGAATGGAAGAPMGGAGGAVATSLTVLPTAAMIPAGKSLDLAAFARSGADYVEVTQSAQWSVDDPSVVMLSLMPAVHVTAGAKVGQTTVRAVYMNVAGSSTVSVVPQGIASITVAPARPSIAVGKTEQLQATAAYGGGQRFDITQQGIWTSADEKVATVLDTPGSRGLVTATGAGSTMVSIRFAGSSGFATVTGVATTSVSGLKILPANATGAAGGNPVVLDAVAAYSDGTTNTVTNAATWTTSNRMVAQVTVGRVQCNVGGSVVITASYMGQSTSTTVTCGSTSLLAVRMIPESTTMPVPVGTALRFMLTAYFSDNTQRNVSAQSEWTSDAPAVATVQATGQNRGLVMAVGPGMATISATYMGMSAKSTLPVR